MTEVGLDRDEARAVLGLLTVDVIDLNWAILDRDQQRSLEWFGMYLRTLELP
jgi:hypothetical protein